MNIIEFLFYYFVFLLSTITLLKSVVKKESYENIIDYKIDIILHQIKKEIGEKLKEGFSVNNTELIGKHFKEKEQKLIYDAYEKGFQSYDTPPYVTNKPTVKANYVNAYEEYSPYIEEFFAVKKK